MANIVLFVDLVYRTCYSAVCCLFNGDVSPGRRGADLTLSPVHRAAQGRLHAVRGVGLRFPRFLRLRPDQAPQDASGPDLIEALFNKQGHRQQRAAEAAGAAAGSAAAASGLEAGRSGFAGGDEDERELEGGVEGSGGSEECGSDGGDVECHSDEEGGT